MTQNRRKSDVELAVLMHKVDTLSDHVIRHMNEEEIERKEIWKELRKLDKKLMFIITPIITAAGGSGIVNMLGFQVPGAS